MLMHYLPYETILGFLVPIGQDDDFISIPHKIWKAYRCVILCLNPFVDGKHLHTWVPSASNQHSTLPAQTCRKPQPQ